MDEGAQERIGGLVVSVQSRMWWCEHATACNGLVLVLSECFEREREMFYSVMVNMVIVFDGRGKEGITSNGLTGCGMGDGFG